MAKGYLKIIEEFDYPPIFLIHPRQFAMLEGEKMKESNSISDIVWGLAAVDYPVFTVHPGISGKARDNVIYHEIGHHLWPWKPHWWLDIFGEKMAGGGGRGYWAKQRNKTIDDLPPRDVLLKLGRRQGEKLKERYKIIK